MPGKTAIIIGAGPAGLTAAYDLLEKTDVTPVIFEESGEIGGISKTVNYKGNRIDIGGHRFFSKSDRVMQWWAKILPMQKVEGRDGETFQISYQNQQRPVTAGAGPDPKTEDKVMLVRERLSRIYFLRRFFDYPITLSPTTVKNLGPWRMMQIGTSYLKVRAFPIRDEKSLEDFYVNRFGRVLYNTFFRDYTEKVWGIPASKIAPDWGAQRVKGLSITKTLTHAAKALLKKRKQSTDVSQKDVETSLIEQFLYPKLGPGQMWEEVARMVTEKGAKLHMHHSVVGLVAGDDKTITALKIKDMNSGEVKEVKGDYFISTMPMKDLVRGIEGVKVPNDVREVAEGLLYRDFVTVGVLLKKLKLQTRTGRKGSEWLIPDNWIYIQEPDVKVGRLQIFNNWSPYMVKDPSTVWLGMEYFCNEGDELWTKPDADFGKFAIKELARMDIIEEGDALDHVVIRVKKTYPAYFGTYDRFDVLKNWVSNFENLFLVGRNGMHRYNNQDHSMLTAMTAVENIRDGVKGKENIWAVNTEQEYHEEKKGDEAAQQPAPEGRRSTG